MARESAHMRVPRLPLSVAIETFGFLAVYGQFQLAADGAPKSVAARGSASCRPRGELVPDLSKLITDLDELFLAGKLGG